MGKKPIFTGLVLAAGVMLMPAMAAGPVPVDLKSCSNFAILASSTITCTGGGLIKGDVGLSPAGSVVLGTPPAQVIGTIYNDDANPIGAQAQLDLGEAYNDAAGRSADRITKAGDIGGQTLPPGLYGAVSTLAITGDLILEGGPDDVWIFQIGSTLTTADGGEGSPASRIILAGGAQPKNIFWQVGSSATLGNYSVFKGTIMAQVSITMNTGSDMDGRALAKTGAVTFNSLVGGLTILSVSVSPAIWAVGAVGTGTVQMSSPGNYITVSNSGNVAETFTLTIADEDDQNEWMHSPSRSGAGNQVYVLSGVFCGGADSPAADKFNQAASDDVLTMTEQNATDAQFAYAEGGATGVAVPAGVGRSLWLRLDMPTAGMGGTEHNITVRVGCFQP